MTRTRALGLVNDMAPPMLAPTNSEAVIDQNGRGQPVFTVEVLQDADMPRTVDFEFGDGAIVRVIVDQGSGSQTFTFNGDFDFGTFVQSAVIVGAVSAVGLALIAYGYTVVTSSC